MDPLGVIQPRNKKPQECTHTHRLVPSTKECVTLFIWSLCSTTLYIHTNVLLKRYVSRVLRTTCTMCLVLYTCAGTRVHVPVFGTYMYWWYRYWYTYMYLYTRVFVKYMYTLVYGMHCTYVCMLCVCYCAIQFYPGTAVQYVYLYCVFENSF